VPRVSPLKVRVFAQCRLRYRYQYVDKDEGRARPRLRPADTAGSLVHRVLCDFYSKLMPAQRTEGRFIEMFEDGWAALSPKYLRMEGVEKHREASLQQLRNYTEKFDWQSLPFMVEPYFQVDIEPGTILFGRLDRLDEEPDGTLHIIDYKTGAMPGDIDPGQLVFYAILVEASLGRTVSKASFWYLDDATVWTTEFSEDDKRRAHAELLATIQEMEEVTEFPGTIGPHCLDCPFFKPCELHDEIVFQAEREGW
jgi:putative RecB family exonuclease